ITIRLSLRQRYGRLGQMQMGTSLLLKISTLHVVFFDKIWVCRHAAFWLPIGKPNGGLTEELKIINLLPEFMFPTNGKEPPPPKIPSALIVEMRISSQTRTINKHQSSGLRSSGCQHIKWS